MRVSALIIISLILGACSFSNFKLPRVHRIAVQQGNVITQEMVDKLKPGMTRSQVAYIMGEPILRSTFDEGRWDYLYTIAVPGYFEQEMRMSLFFEDDALSYFTGDLAPTAALSDDVVEEVVEEGEEEEQEEEATEE